MRLLTERTDRWIVGGAALLFLLSVTLLLNERFFSLLRFSEWNQLSSVAKVTHTGSDVRRRVETDLVWYPTLDQDEVFAGDSLFTGEGSDAEIKFKNGTKLSIDPSSLVVIHAPDRSRRKAPEVEVKRGVVAVKLAGDQRLLLTSPGGKVSELTGSDAVVKVATDGAKTQVTVVSGKALIKSDNQLRELSKNATASLGFDPPKPAPLRREALPLPRQAQQAPAQPKTIVSKQHPAPPSEISAEAEHFAKAPTQPPVLPSQPAPSTQAALSPQPTLPKSPPQVVKAPTPVVLQPPVQLAPGDRVERTGANAKVRFRWRKVDGATRYEVRISPPKKVRDIASTAEVLHLVTTDEQISADLDQLGNYTWEVRALAEVNSSLGRPDVIVGPLSSSHFEVRESSQSSSLLDRDQPGYVSVSSMIAPYAYRLISPSQNLLATASSGAVMMRLGGEYRLLPRFAVGLSGESTLFTISQTTYKRFGGELLLKYRLIGESKTDWTLTPRLGIEARQYFTVTPTSSTEFTALGAQLGFEVRKGFTDQFSAGAHAAYFLPVSLLGNSSVITGDASYRNASAGIDALYWFRFGLGVSMGGSYELRSISYTVNGSLPDQVYTDGAYFFTSLRYRFGMNQGAAAP